MNQFKKIIAEHIVYHTLRSEYPDYVWHNEIEKLMDEDFNATKKLLAYWFEKDYIKKRDSKGRGEFPDDMLYALTAKGMDELSIWGRVTKILSELNPLSNLKIK